MRCGEIKTRLSSLLPKKKGTRDNRYILETRERDERKRTKIRLKRSFVIYDRDYNEFLSAGLAGL